MRETLKRLLRMVVGYSAIQWAGPLLTLFFTPIITRLLTPSDYGVADYALTISSAVGTLSLLGLPQALGAHFNDVPSTAWQRRLTGSALAVGWLVGVPVGLGLVILAPYVSQSAFGDARHTDLFRIVGLAVAFGVCSAIVIAAAQAALRVRWGMRLSLATIVSTVAGNVLFIIVLRLGASGLVLTTVMTSVLVSLVGLITVRPLIGRPSWELMRRISISGASLFPTVLSGWVLLVADRLILVHYVSTEALGHYAIANKIASMAHIALAPMYTAWTSLGLSFQNAPGARSRYANLARYLIAVALVVTLALGLFANEILTVLTRPAYLPAAPYVSLLTYVQVFTGYGTALYISAMAAKQLITVSWTIAAGALLNIVLNFVLIPQYGLWGASFATVAGYVLPQLLLYWALQRRYPVPYPAARLVAATALHAGLLTAGLFLTDLAFPARVAAKLAMFALLPASFMVLGIVTRAELQAARLSILHRLRLAGLDAG